MAGYSSTPLVQKLGIKAGFSVYTLNAPPEYFSWIHPLPGNISIKLRAARDLDFVHIFSVKEKDYQAQFLKSKKLLKKNGMLWVSWPKKASKVETDLDENKIHDFGLANGLVDVKVCAVSEIWSGLKFVYRTVDR